MVKDAFKHGVLVMADPYLIRNSTPPRLPPTSALIILMDCTFVRACIDRVPPVGINSGSLPHGACYHISNIFFTSAVKHQLSK